MESIVSNPCPPCYFLKGKKMEVHQDFTGRKLTLVFDSGKKEELTTSESKEFEVWLDEKLEENR